MERHVGAAPPEGAPAEAPARPVIPEEFWPAAVIFCTMLRRALALSQQQEQEPSAAGAPADEQEVSGE